MTEESEELLSKISDQTPLQIIEERVELKYRTLIEQLEEKLRISRENEKATTVIYAVEHPHGEIKYKIPSDELTQKLWDQREIEEKLSKVSEVMSYNERLKKKNTDLHNKFTQERERRNELVENKVELIREDHKRMYEGLKESYENKLSQIKEDHEKLYESINELNKSKLDQKDLSIKSLQDTLTKVREERNNKKDWKDLLKEKWENFKKWLKSLD